jgi:hypothetical protein
MQEEQQQRRPRHWCRLIFPSSGAAIAVRRQDPSARGRDAAVRI